MQDLDERMSIDMVDVSNRIPEHVQVLTIHGSKDETIPVEDGFTFAQRLRGQRLLVVENADHNYSQPSHSEQMIKAAVDFLTGKKL